MTWRCAEGECFLGRTGNDLHLFFVLTNPMKLVNYGHNLQVLSVNVSSIYEGKPYDNTCEVEVGEHPFIQHKSYVYYSKMRLDSAQHIEQLVQSGTFPEKEPCSNSLIQRILQGALRSRHTSREYKQIIHQYLQDTGQN